MHGVEKNAARLFVGALAIIASVLGIAGGGFAQQPAPQPAPQHAKKRPPAETAPVQAAQTQPTPTIDTPQRTTATYEDWIVQCELRTGPPPEKFCEMMQVTQVQGRNAPFSRIAIARPAKGQPVRLVIQVPVNVSFSTNVRIQATEGDAGIAVPFARCVPAGCFADFDLKEDVMKKFRAAAGAGKLTFADDGGHDVTVPLSFKGFPQAYDALAKE